MKEIILTINIEVNGKKVDIRFFRDKELHKILEERQKKGIFGGICDEGGYCKLRGLCKKLKNPCFPEGPTNFSEFCGDISVAGIDPRKWNKETKEELPFSREEIKEMFKTSSEIIKEVLEEGREEYYLEDIIMGIEENLIPLYEDVEPILEDLKRD